MKINKLICKKSYINKNKPKFIIIHDTGNYGKGANAKANANYFLNSETQSSAHYCIDDKEIYQSVEDKDGAWHIGDGFKNDKWYSEATNTNTLGFELCINPETNREVAKQNLINLVIEKMKEFNIPAENILRHNDASGKNCPQSMNKNGNWYEYFELKRQIQLKLKGGEMKFETLDDIKNSIYGKEGSEVIEKLYKKGFLKGIGDGYTFNVFESELKVYMVHDRAGFYD